MFQCGGSEILGHEGFKASKILHGRKSYAILTSGDNQPKLYFIRKESTTATRYPMRAQVLDGGSTDRGSMTDRTKRLVPEGEEGGFTQFEGAAFRAEVDWSVEETIQIGRATKEDIRSKRTRRRRAG